MAEIPHTPHTDFARFVVDTIKASSSLALNENQAVIRSALALSPTFLLTDNCTNPDSSGSDTWLLGLNHLADILVALHARNELEVARRREHVLVNIYPTVACCSLQTDFSGRVLDGRRHMARASLLSAGGTCTDLSFANNAIDQWLVIQSRRKNTWHPNVDYEQPTPQSPQTLLNEVGTPNSTDPSESIPLASSPVQDSPSTTGLTPLRAHYLKKSLIQLEFERELDEITSPTPSHVSALSYLGPPFSPPPKNSPMLDLPFLRYIFRQFVLTFPFMASAPKDFYSDKLQPFTNSVMERNLSPTSVFDQGEEGSEAALRSRLLAKAQRNLSLFFSAATKLTDKEEVVRLTQSDLERLEAAAKRRQARNLEAAKDIFEVNIVSVRTVVDKGRVRSRVHEEFIIRTRRSNLSDVFVSRRYGDFKTLAEELRKAHPSEEIRSPPVKDRTTVTAPPSATSPLSPAPSFASQQSWDDYPSGSQVQQNSRLAREKNRLTLRAYLHSLLASPVIASSPVLRSFLLSGPTALSREEIEDGFRREEADRVRDEGRKQFAKEIANRVDGLRAAVKSVKGDIMGKGVPLLSVIGDPALIMPQDGLTRIFALVKVTPNVRDLPDNYKAVLEWARMSSVSSSSEVSANRDGFSLASTVFHHFVASDTASESFASLKRIHGLMPYLLLKTALRISNPIAMIRTQAVMDLFLAQPFGGRSLLQRMFTGSLTEEVHALEEEIEAVKEKIDDPMICEKMRQFVYAPREIQDLLKADAAAEQMSVITVVLRAADAPFLSRAQMSRVARAHRAHAAYMKQRESLNDSDDDDGPQDEDGWLFEDLKVLADLYSRLRDREQLIELLFEARIYVRAPQGHHHDFYAPLAQVYRAASIADSIGDLQSFINDLIKTVERTEDLAQEDPKRTVQAFIALIERHEQSFYHFVHKVHSKGEGLFSSLMRWIELYLTVVREGLGDPLSLEFLLPHTGEERDRIMDEVDKVAVYHYKLKVLYEDKIRRRFGKARANANDADAEDEMTKALVDGVAQEIDFGELIHGDAIDVAAQDTDEEDEDDDDDSEFESASDSGSDEEGNSEEDTDRSAEETPMQTPRPPPKTLLTVPRPISLKSSRSMSSPRFSPRATTAEEPRSSHVEAASTKSVSNVPESQNGPFPSSYTESTAAAPKIEEKRGAAIQPPDLVYLPKLLPIFREMMRPQLAPRQRTN
ncbi:unnamed protein product [Mycena citricolor]|uniref:PX domain-containing protein n=1 Tax=Mycena citricolor TaxID=2018698 RepID=A0AAD2HF59_9AGAR|nr:unnamed protein product [Mycena citricolor]